MATAVATPTITRRFKVGRTIQVFGTIAITASPATYATGGLVCDFSGKIPGCKKAPLNVEVNGINGFWYSFAYGSGINNGKLLAYVATSVGGGNLPQTEATNAAAIPAGISGDTISFNAQFDALN